MESKIKSYVVSTCVSLASAIILGLITWYPSMIWGANHGCNKFLDNLFNSGGYESCGSAGFWIGAIVGGFLGFFISQKLQKKDANK